MQEKSISKGLLDWRHFDCRLLRYYRDAPPFGGRERCDTENLIIWHLLKGEVIVELEEGKFKAKAGEWVALNRGIRIQEFSPEARLESIHIQVASGRAVWRGSRGSLLPEGAVLRKSAMTLGAEALRLGVQGREWAEEITPHMGLVDIALLQRAIWNFFAELVPHLIRADMTLQEPEINDPRVEQSLLLIEEMTISDAWDREHIAASTGLSASQLDRNWLAALGETPFQYWNARRVQYAREKLENTRWSIKEIASELGFTQLARFSNWFRSNQQLSPRAYRERVASKSA